MRGGLGDLARDRHEELAKQECPGRRGDQRQDQSGIAVQQVHLHLEPRAFAGEQPDQLADVERVEQPDRRCDRVRDDLERRHDAHFHRQHQGDEDQPENQRLEAKVEIDDREGRQDRNQDLADGDADRDDRAIEKLAPEIGFHPRRRDIGGEEIAREQWHRKTVQLVDAQRRADEHHEHRQAGEQDCEHEDRMARQVEDRRALDHHPLMTRSGRGVRSGGTGPASGRSRGPSGSRIVRRTRRNPG